MEVLGEVELVREAATLLMLLTIGMLGRTDTDGSGWGYTAIAFGVVGHSVLRCFLRIICGWPKSLLDWDILFLLPLPWWDRSSRRCRSLAADRSGARRTTQSRGSISDDLRSVDRLGSGAIGILLALYVFMADALPRSIKVRRHQAGPPDIVRVDVVLRLPSC